jgi:hypothetical protein
VRHLSVPLTFDEGGSVMGNVLKIGIATVLIGACCVSAADDSAPTAEGWVGQYVKLGGKAFLCPPDEGTIGIQKQEGQKPIVGLKGLKPPTGIRRVVLQGFEIADDDLVALAAWKDLEGVEVIDGKKVTDKGVAALTALPNLRELMLADTAVTAAGVNAFSGRKELRQLTVSNTIVANKVAGIDLKDMPKLQRLTLVCPGMTAVRLTELPLLESVNDLPAELERAEVSKAGALKELDFRGTKLKMLSLTGVPKLELLDLRKTFLDADAVAGIQQRLPGVKVRR